MSVTHFILERLFVDVGLSLGYHLRFRLVGRQDDSLAELLLKLTDVHAELLSHELQPVGAQEVTNVGLASAAVVKVGVQLKWHRGQTDAMRS